MTTEDPIYALPESPSFPAETYARDRVTLSSQFRKDVVARYISNYENFWAIGREEVGIEEMQAILNRLGSTAISILSDASLYIQGIAAAFPNDLPAKYHTAPYTYEIDGNTGGITLLALKPEWEPEEEPEEPGE